MTDLAGVDAELAQVAYQEAKDLAAATVSPRHPNELKKAYDKLKAADDEMLKAVQLAALGQYDKAIDLSCKAWQESVLAKDYVRRATL